MNKNGFTFIEILVVVAIIGIVSTVASVLLLGARSGARDAKRMSDINQIGRFLSFGCVIPEAGVGEYDLTEMLEEYRDKYPQYANAIPNGVRDPLAKGTDSNYKYLVDEDGDCVLYANLEKDDEGVTLFSISEPTPAGGKGVFESATTGWNGSKKYFQASN